MAHFVCGVLMIGLGVGIALLCMPIPLIPLDPIIGLMGYVGIVVPISISCGTAIHPLTYQGLLIISGVQFGIVEWWCFQVSKAYHHGTGSLDIDALVIGVVVTQPLCISHCLWLKLQRRLLKQRQTVEPS